jgi:hypothetical protein
LVAVTVSVTAAIARAIIINCHRPCYHINCQYQKQHFTVTQGAVLVYSGRKKCRKYKQE